MRQDSTTRILFVALLIFVLVVAYRVIAPFLSGLFWAAVLVAAFNPLRNRLERLFGGRPKAAAAVVTVMIAAFVAVPILAAAVKALQAGITAAEWIVTNFRSGGMDLGLTDRWPQLGNALEHVKSLLGMGHVDLQAMLVSGLEKLLQYVGAKGPALVSSTFGLIFSFGVMLLAMPMLFTNRTRVASALIEALPVPDADAKRIVGELILITRSMFSSVVLTAAVQALLGGAALLVLGVPHAMSLTAVMLFCAVLPGGTAIVWAPVAIWLAATGHPAKAAFLAIWGAGVLSTIDNVLRPIFAGKGVELPTSMLVVGTLGGVISFGFVGLFLGPIALYLARELVATLRRDGHGRPASETSP
jgi:predicted PurR-regulated permease PerM